jgi:hypothetical protein
MAGRPRRLAELTSSATHIHEPDDSPIFRALTFAMASTDPSAIEPTAWSVVPPAQVTWLLRDSDPVSTASHAAPGWTIPTAQDSACAAEMKCAVCSRPAGGNRDAVSSGMTLCSVEMSTKRGVLPQIAGTRL